MVMSRRDERMKGGGGGGGGEGDFESGDLYQSQGCAS